MKVHFHGHACFEIETGGKRLIIDPWLKGNPLADIGPESIDADYVLLTHGHYDHLGDSLEIAGRCGATIVAVSELAKYCAARGAAVKIMNLGGAVLFPFGRLTMVPALHSSSVATDGGSVYAGAAAGYLLESEGLSVYHAGDTALFGDMALLGRRGGVDLALLPIGGGVTMGEEDAICAARLVGARRVIPMHYNSFPDIICSPEDFAINLGMQLPDCKCRLLAPGESCILPERREDRNGTADKHTSNR